MNRHNPGSPWNPRDSVQISPSEYEQQVIAWLRASKSDFDRFTIRHSYHLSGTGGDYEFDGVAEFALFGGARLIVLVECKRCNRPVERDEVMSLWAKLQDVGAHKAMVFSTSGFQSGALEFATSRGIATITFVSGAFQYETRGLGPTSGPPSWVELPKFVGLCVTKEGGVIHCSTIDDEHQPALRTWLNMSRPDPSC